METKLENLEGLKRKLVIRFPASALEQPMAKRIHKLSQEITLKGFRKGKIPPQEIKKRFGPTVRAEELDKVAREYFAEAMKSLEQLPLAVPRVDIVNPDFTPDEDVELHVTYEVAPELPEINYADIKLTQPKLSVTEKEIDSVIQEIREEKGQWHTQDRPAAYGDRVLVDYTAGAAGSKHKETHRGIHITLDKDEESDFSKELVGAVVGDIKYVDLTPITTNESDDSSLDDEDSFDKIDESLLEDDSDDDLDDDIDDDIEGENSFVTVSADLSDPSPSDNMQVNTIDKLELHVKGIESLTLASMADILPENCNNETDFRTQLRKQMEKYKQQNIRAELREKCLVELGSAFNCQLPQDLVEEEYSGVLEKEKSLVPESEIDQKLLREETEVRVKALLAMGDIVKKQGFEADNKDMEEAIIFQAGRYSDPQAFVDAIKSNKEQLEKVRNTVLQDKALDFVIENATLTVDTSSEEQESESSIILPP